MGDTNLSARESGKAFDAELDDPFEELARLLDEPLKVAPMPQSDHRDPAQTVETTPAGEPAAADPADEDSAEFLRFLDANGSPDQPIEASADPQEAAGQESESGEEAAAVVQPEPQADPEPQAESTTQVDLAAHSEPMIAAALAEELTDALEEAAQEIESEAVAEASVAEPVLQKPLPKAAPAVPPAVNPARPAPAATSGAAGSYARWIGQQTETPAAPAAKAPVTSDQMFEQALLGLSTPANPRQPTIHRSEAFAPERPQAHVEPEPTPQVFDDFDELIASELAAIKQDGAQTSAEPAKEPGQPEWAAGLTQDDRRTADEAGSHAFDGWAPGQDEFESKPNPAVLARRAVSGRGIIGSLGLGALVLMLAAGGAYFVLGGAGSMAGGDDGEVLIVRADPDPVKVKPDNPGGREIPNKNKIVYDRVESGDSEAAPSQKTLLKAAEKPVDLPKAAPVPDPVDLPGVEIGLPDEGAGEPVRVADASSEASPIAVLTPRRVKTYTVRPDGTLVAAETTPQPAIENLRERGALIEAAARPVALEPLPGDAAGEGQAAADGVASDEATGEPAPNVPVPTARPGARNPGETALQVAAAPEAEAPLAAPPAADVDAATGSVLPAQTEEVQVASLEPEPAPQPVHDGYYVQISSQPSQGAAESSSQSLKQRFSGVIGGRSVVIQTADIPGKGTYYRVRIPVDSRTEASRLCGDLKSAGGSCFVAR
ncbi:SPOR domain-containing protein [Jiella marina]|uniref:SPOR domain-containing protein n=1 Tax=Jiella sp. LLJ827 TaxID=2917712 RepID=UPI002101CDB5|nr:SPOR domain-containing protein [Jiella sp. LLJ827]MCQ0987448.1 SPOR domain-containing protein [Jiella sp. LLJ827]